jgi:hypothetical protein
LHTTPQTDQQIKRKSTNKPATNHPHIVRKPQHSAKHRNHTRFHTLTRRNMPLRQHLEPICAAFAGEFGVGLRPVCGSLRTSLL